MSVIDGALTTLALAKETAGIPSGFTDDDSLLERKISALSMAVSIHCDRIFGSASGIPSYVEKLSPPNRQLLLLKQWPIVSITSIMDNGYPLVLDTDYKLDAQEKARGEVYKANGWMGAALVTGMTLDPVANARLLTVEYTAGYFLPGDFVGYVEGALSSLPFDLVDFVSRKVAEAYYATKRQNFGLKSLSEGGVSYSFSDTRLLTEEDKEYLNAYRRLLA
jgi:hypothetical protein